MPYAMPPPLPPPPTQPRPVLDRMAVASLIASGLGCLLLAVPAAVGVVLGHLSHRRIRRSAGTRTGGGYATAGLVIGYGAILCWCGCLFLATAAPGFLRSLRTSDSERAERILRLRQDFRTRLIRQEREDCPADEPPVGSGLRLTDYPGPLGPMAAYVPKDPGDGKKHPALIWLAGGFSNSIESGMLERGPRENDQSAGAFREAGLLLMYPSLRGGNRNPGYKEGFLGEVDDVRAALGWLRQQPFIDASRVYLGGHSTGGTLALLVAATAPELRGVIAFGPVHEVDCYGQDNLPFRVTQAAELAARNPARFVGIIRPPTVVIEGEDGNAGSLRLLRARTLNRQVRYFEIAGADHFAVLRPLSEVLARAVLEDTGQDPELRINQEMLDAAMNR